MLGGTWRGPSSAPCTLRARLQPTQDQWELAHLILKLFMLFVHFLLYIQKIFSYMGLIPQVQFSREMKNSVSPLTESPLTKSPFVHSPPKPSPPGPPLFLSVASPGQPEAAQKTSLAPESLPTSKGRGEGLPIKGETTPSSTSLGFSNLSGHPIPSGDPAGPWLWAHF